MSSSSGPYADLDRPPLSQRAVAAALAHDPGPVALWREVRVVAETSSTNADVSAAAAAGEPEGLVVVAEHQRGGRGRLGRSWVSPPRSGLTFSMLFRPGVPTPAAPLLPLLVAVAAAGAVSERTELDVRLKWPNDLVVDDRKVAGLLAEAAGGAVVVGIGLNVSTRRDELPRPDATSLQLETGEAVDRHPLLLAILRAVAEGYAEWREAGGSALTVMPRYRSLSATIGRPVRVELPAGEELVGTVLEVDDGGRLVVESAGGMRAVSAGDVVHLRAAP